MNELIRNSVEFPPILDFMSKLRSIDMRGRKTFNMVQAVPPYPTFLPIREKLAEKLKDESVSFYSDVPGIEILRRKIVTGHPVQGLAPEQVIVTAGANNAMFLAMKLLFNHGDEVALLEPYYFNYDMALKMLGLKPVYLSLQAENKFEISAQSLISQVQQMPHLKGVILITPNNPTGAIYPAEEVRIFSEWAALKKIEVIVDETYGSFDSNHLKTSNLLNLVGKTFHLVGSFSKSFSLTGYRVGYFISGNEQIQQALKIQDTNIICASHLGQWAAYFGLEYCQEHVTEKVKIFQSYQDLLKEKTKRLKNFKLHSVGVFFAYLEHPFKDLSCENATLKLYENTGIMGLPGTVFGKTQSQFIRLAFCNLTEAELNHAIEQLNVFDHSLS